MLGLTLNIKGRIFKRKTIYRSQKLRLIKGAVTSPMVTHTKFILRYNQLLMPQHLMIGKH